MHFQLQCKPRLRTSESNFIILTDSRPVFNPRVRFGRVVTDSFRSVLYHSVIGFVIALLLFFTNIVQIWAHPLGNFTINHYARLEPDRAQLRVRYVLDLAEIPTFQELRHLDADQDNVISETEREIYLAARAPELIRNLELVIDARSATLELEPGTAFLELQQGQGGLEVMRLSFWLRAPLQLDAAGTTITFADTNFSERMGWREMIARAGKGVTVQNSSVPAQDVSQELVQYPPELMSSPPDQRSATFVVVPAVAPGVVAGNASNPITTGALGAFDRTRDEFSKLITTNQELSPTVWFLSLLAAMALGALHAFSPGHGKAVVGAYLVGSHGTWQNAVFLGLVVTATHTAGVYALGFVTLFLSAYILPEQLYPWLGFLSGLLVAFIGVQLFFQRWRAARQPHRNEQTGAHTHIHADGTTHSHPSDHQTNSPAAHSHTFTSPEQEAAHARKHLDEIEWMEKPSRRNLLTLGISGGLLPCPSALVVMLSAIGLGRVLFGLYLILGFSVGLAGVLVLTGLALLYAGKLAGRVMRGQRASRFFRYVPILGALVVAALGTFIALDAFLQSGFWK